MKKKTCLSVVGIVLLATMCMSACAKKNDAPSIEIETIAEDSTEVAETEDAAIAISDFAVGRSVIEDGDAVYMVSRYRVAVYNRSTKETKVLWTKEGHLPGRYDAGEGAGILVGDKIYFETNMVDANDSTNIIGLQFNVINTDGSGYEVVAEYPNKDTGITMYGGMMLKDGVIYYGGDGQNDCFKIDDDGNITETVARKDMEAYASVPEGYETPYLMDEGYVTMFPVATAAEYNEVLLRSPDYTSVILYPSDGTVTNLEGMLVCADDDKIITYQSNDVDGKYTYTYYCHTMTGTPQDEPETELFTLDNSLNIFDYENGLLYYITSAVSDSGELYYEYRTMDENMTSNVIYEQHVEQNAFDVSAGILFRDRIEDNYLYTITSKDCAMYYAKVNLDNGEVELLGEPYYDSGIENYGRIQNGTAAYKNEDGVILISSKATTFFVDERYPGAAAINEVMQQHYDNALAIGDSDITEATQLYNDYKDSGWFNPYSCETSVSNVAFCNDEIISFMQDGYDYYGGAHGMPYRAPFTFDLNSGAKLALRDVVGNSEEDFKAVVLSHVQEIFDAGEEGEYWDDMMDTASQYTDLDMGYLLTDDGVLLWYDPYLLSSYARGFVEVLIPYSELDMKINVQ